MKAQQSAQRQLLAIQELDSRFLALRHRAQNPPQAAELTALGAERAQIDGRAADAQIEVDDLTRQQRRADNDVEQVKLRRLKDQHKLDSGSVGNPKDLERLQHELVSLDKRISDLEDTELEVMEALETAQAKWEALNFRRTGLDEKLAELTAAKEELIADLRTQAGDLRSQRASLIDKVEPDLLALYERLRETMGGVGASLLRQRRCGGCSLELNASELSAISKLPADEVVRCDECGRILVRTEESGL